MKLTKIRNLEMTPLFEVGKTYNIDSQSPNYYKEDEKGTLRPNTTHAYVSWQAFWESTLLDQESHWSDQAEIVYTLEEGKQFIEDLKKNYKCE